MPTDLTLANSPLAGIHDYQRLVLGPLLETSKVLKHLRVIQTSGGIEHVPTGKAAATGWYAENAEITQSEDLVDEIVVTPRKAASLAKLSNELASDTSPGGLEQIGNILVASVRNTVDSAFFTGTGVAPQPNGLGALTGFSAVTTGLSLDGMADAISAIETAGGTATVAWVNPGDWATIVKAVTDHPTVSPTGPLQRSLLGVTVETTKHVAPGTIWVADGNEVVAVVRTDGEVAVSRDAKFTSDSTLVRVVSRIDYAYPFPAVVARLTAA